MLDKKADLIAQGEKVRWLPEHMGKRYRNWVENLEWDWCISRQRFYGVPFPFWHCKGCGERGARARRGPARRPDGDAPPGPVRDVRRRRDFEPERDVMDTWATSSETPQINARWGERRARPPRPRCPMSLRPQAHEIIRTWAFYTIAKSWLHLRRRAVARRDDLGPRARRRTARRSAKSKGNAPTTRTALVDEARRRRRALLGALREARHRLPVQRGGPRLGPAPLREALERARGWRSRHLAGLRPRGAARRRERAVDRGIRARLARDRRRRRRRLSTPTSSGSRRSDVEEFFWNDLCDNWLEMVEGPPLRRARPRTRRARRAAQAAASRRALRPCCGSSRRSCRTWSRRSTRPHFAAPEGARPSRARPGPTAERPADDDPGARGVRAGRRRRSRACAAGAPRTRSRPGSRIARVAADAALAAASRAVRRGRGRRPRRGPRRGPRRSRAPRRPRRAGASRSLRPRLHAARPAPRERRAQGPPCRAFARPRVA